MRAEWWVRMHETIESVMGQSPAVMYVYASRIAGESTRYTRAR